MSHLKSEVVGLPLTMTRPDRRILKFLGLLFSLFCLLPGLASAQVARELVGKYQMEVTDGDILELRADGSAALAGEETRWSASGNQLSVGPDVMGYVLQGNRLTLTMGTIQLTWKKLGGRSQPAVSPMRKAAAKTAGAQPPAAGSDEDAQARQLLTSTAWCSFTYNQHSGTSTTRKVLFRPDGIMTINGGAETWSSGYAGTYAGQSSSQGALRWKVENLRLLVDADDGNGYQDIGLNATKNSNGYVILHAQGREYSMCR